MGYILKDSSWIIFSKIRSVRHATHSCNLPLLKMNGSHPQDIIDAVNEPHNSSDFIPQRVICFPVDNSNTTTNAINFALNKIIKPELDLVVLLHCRTPIGADAGLIPPFLLPTGTQF